MGTISGQATGRYGAWVLEVRYTTTPVSSGAYFNVNANLYFKTTGTATIAISARPSGAYLNVNGVQSTFSPGALNGSNAGGWYFGTVNTTVRANSSGGCSFSINAGFNVRATLDGTYVAWIYAGGTGNNSAGGGGGVTPTITSFSFGNKTDTTQKFSWNTNINSDYCNVQLNGANKGTYGSKTNSSLTGLTPNTNYTLYIRGHNGYGYGSWRGPYTFKTYPTNVTVSSITITDITPFGCTISTSSSNSSTTNAVEYSIYDSTGQELVQGPYVVSPVQWIYYIDNLDPETTYTVKVRVRTSESNNWSDYSTRTFTTLTDQADSYFKVNGTWSKGKVYGKNNGSWVEAKKIYVKSNGSWLEGVNN